MKNIVLKEIGKEVLKVAGYAVAVTTVAALVLLSVSPANAGVVVVPPGNGQPTYVDFAQVIYVEEVRRTSTTKRHTDCHDVVSHVQTRGDGNLLNEAIGGIIGGLLGNQVGKGSGKTAATIAGVIIGGTVANSTEGTNTTTVTSTVCDRITYDTVEHEISHYLVTYSYNGHTFKMKQTRRPYGDSQRMRISITPYN